MTIEQILMFPLSGRFYTHGEIEEIINNAMSLVIPASAPAALPALAKTNRRNRRKAA
jgi:hypothetical protein